MVSEVVLSSEGFVADVAGVGSLVCVGPLVDEEVVGLCEMPAAKLANKFLFGLGREPSPGGLSVRGQLAQLGDGGQLGQIRGFRRVLLRGGEGQVSEVESRPVLVQRGDAVSHTSLFRVEELGRGSEGQRGEGDPGVHQTLGGCHLRDCRPQSLDVRVAQSPVVHVHGLHCAEAVKPLQLVGGERVDGLQEGVVGELEGRVQRDRCVQGFAPHLASDACGRRGDDSAKNRGETQHECRVQVRKHQLDTTDKYKQVFHRTDV